MKRFLVVVWIVFFVVFAGSTAAQSPEQVLGSDSEKINLLGPVSVGSNGFRIVVFDCKVVGHEEPIDDTVPYLIFNREGILHKSSFRLQGGVGAIPIAVPWDADYFSADLTFYDQIAGCFIIYDGTASIPPPPRFVWEVIWSILRPPHIQLKLTRYKIP